MIHKRSITIHSIANSFANKQGLTLDYSIFFNVYKSILWMARKTVEVKHKSILDEMNSYENFKLESANFNLEVQHSNIEVFLTKIPLIFTIENFPNWLSQHKHRSIKYQHGFNYDFIFELVFINLFFINQLAFKKIFLWSKDSVIIVLYLLS